MRLSLEAYLIDSYPLDVIYMNIENNVLDVHRNFTNNNLETSGVTQIWIVIADCT